MIVSDARPLGKLSVGAHGNANTADKLATFTSSPMLADCCTSPTSFQARSYGGDCMPPLSLAPLPPTFGTRTRYTSPLSVGSLA